MTDKNMEVKHSRRHLLVNNHPLCTFYRKSFILIIVIDPYTEVSNN